MVLIILIVVLVLAITFSPGRQIEQIENKLNISKTDLNRIHQFSFLIEFHVYWMDLYIPLIFYLDNLIAQWNTKQSFKVKFKILFCDRNIC